MQNSMKIQNRAFQIQQTSKEVKKCVPDLHNLQQLTGASGPPNQPETGASGLPNQQETGASGPSNWKETGASGLQEAGAKCDSATPIKCKWLR